MIGSKYFEITGEDLLAGVTSGPDTQDGGLSSESVHFNPIVNPGTLYPPGAITDKSTNLTDEIIASCEDPTYLGNDRMCLDDSGSFYTYNGTTLTLKVTASGDLFTQGTTDFVPFYDVSNGTNFYATTKAGSNGDIVKWNGNATLTETWWSGAGTLNQGALSAITPWRPLLNYETFLYVGDNNKLHRISNGLVVSNGILTLNQTETISALGVDKGTGKMLIATTQGADYSGSRNGKSRIYLYDGYSNKAIRVCEVSGTITSFKSVDSTTYVFYGNKLGYFTGSGIKYLRTLGFSIGSGTELAYPHKVCSIDNTLYWVENKTAMAFGETIRDQKVFYPALSPDTSSQDMNSLFPVGGSKLGYSYASSKFFTFDTVSSSVVINGGALVYSKRYKFPKPVTFNGVLFEFDTVVPSNDNVLTVRVKDSRGNTSASNTLNVGSRTDVYEWEMDQPTIDTRSIQLLLTWGGGSTSLGIRRATVFYTPKE